MKQKILQTVFAALLCASANAQVNSGSNGSDGALDYSSLTNLGYSTNIVINMADHPTGIYQYTYVNIPNNLTVTFIPNANGTPVTWLVQGNCTIEGVVDLSGQADGQAGPGGYAGGNSGTIPQVGRGPGGGQLGSFGGNGSYATQGGTYSTGNFIQGLPGPIYGNNFLIPLIGGSGGGGGSSMGSGGGGAILIAASGTVQLDGQILANGGDGGNVNFDSNGNPRGSGGAGSGGAVRLVATHLLGYGNISVGGGTIYDYSFYGYGGGTLNTAGSGRVRTDAIDNNSSIHANGVFTQGYQPIIIPTAGQGAQLTVTSVGGVPVSASPTGALSTPDAVLSAQQNNPIPVVVSCANLPLNTQITVSVKPASGAAVSATGLNSTGTLSSSTATISTVMPRGGGLIYATAATSN